VTSLPETEAPADAEAAGAAAAVTGAPQPERGNDEAEHELGRLSHPEAEGSPIAAPSARRLNWLA